jgi:hypothetical protein
MNERKIHIEQSNLENESTKNTKKIKKNLK